MSNILHQATFLRRYKRFLADVILSSGEQITVHCPNTGSMKNCLEPHSPCWLIDSGNPKRKYRFSLDRVTSPQGGIICVNSAGANALAVFAIQAGHVSELSGYASLSTEAKYGQENSRVDILLNEHADNPKQLCYVEVKSVTLEEGSGKGYFPDSISLRGQKHIRELIAVRAQGHRAVLFFCAQNSNIQSVRAARHIDKAYADLISEAIERGVEILAYAADPTVRGGQAGDMNCLTKILFVSESSA